MAEGKTTPYRLFDAEDRLLYVGINWKWLCYTHAPSRQKQPST
jgi:hypothetical protein